MRHGSFSNSLTWFSCCFSFEAHPPYLSGGIGITVVLFATGIELWLFGFRYGEQWATLHKAAFVLWFLAITVHVVAYLRRSAALTVADWRAHLPGALARQSLILAGLVLGVALLIAMLSFRSPFLFALGAG